MRCCVRAWRGELLHEGDAGQTPRHMVAAWGVLLRPGARLKIPFHGLAAPPVRRRRHKGGVRVIRVPQLTYTLPPSIVHAPASPRRTPPGSREVPEAASAMQMPAAPASMSRRYIAFTALLQELLLAEFGRAC